MTVLSVSELSEQIRDALSDKFPQAISVEGEISNFSASQNGHWYFTLKDETSQIAIVMFRGNNTSVSFLPANGMQVQINGSISFYHGRGQCQIICTYIQKQGMGSILAMLEKRKEKLHKEGLFAKEHKKDIPIFPTCIGILTSNKGAAIQDIYRTFTSYGIAPKIILFHTAVQGYNASEDIIDQLHNATQHSPILDVLIITRGGGSTEDLLAYSDEQLVRSIYECPIPIITAVGHEIDTSLCDLVADISVATPTASANFIAEKMLKTKQSINNNKEYITHIALQKLQSIKQTIKTSTITNAMREFSFQISNIRQHLDFISEKINTSISQTFTNIKQKLQYSKTYFTKTSPSAILQKGYTLIHKHTNTSSLHTNDLSNNKEILITKANILQHNDSITITFYDGKEHAIIKKHNNI